MKIREHSKNEEKQVLIGMIVSKTILAKIAAKWTGRMFKTGWANMIGNWCV